MTVDIPLNTAASIPAPRPVPASTTAQNWRRAYANRLLLTDTITLVVVVFGTQVIWRGTGNANVAMADGVHITPLSYGFLSMLLVAAWLWALGLADTRTERVIGIGTTEYVDIAKTSVLLFGILTIIAFLLRADIARGYLVISLPVGVAFLVTERWAWRQWLVARRRRAQFTARVLLVGSHASVAQIAHDFERNPNAGYTVVGACTPDGASPAGLHAPVVGTFESIIEAMQRTDADTVAVTSTGGLGPMRLKRLSWQLESGKQHLVLAPSLTDVAGPRIHTRPVAGLPLIHVETPHFSRGQRLGKRMLDLVGSTLLIMLLSPILAALAVVVKTSSPGPVFFRHERIGQNGRPFRIIKFRSMRRGADAELATLLAAQGTDDTPLFKVTDDPRITPVGRLLRKYSLDELPQLFNVFAGSMSLVGPRPQVAREVALYTDAARRRLLFRPGMSGLWQVSGRSNLDWTDAVRLDLYYVENWSLLGDLAILIRTIKAVVTPATSAV